MAIHSVFKFSRSLCVACSLLIWVVSVQAAGYVNMGPSFSGVDLSRGFYGGLEVGTSKTDSASAFAAVAGHDVTSGDIKKHLISARAFMGWIFHPNFAVEIGLFDIPKIKLSHLNYDETDPPQNQSVELNLLAADLAAKLILPVTDQIRLFTRAGVVYLRAHSSDKVDLTAVPTNSCTSCKLSVDGESKFTFLLGIGASFAFTEAAEVYFAWTNYYDSDFFSKNAMLTTNVETKSIGVIYRTV